MTPAAASPLSKRDNSAFAAVSTLYRRLACVLLGHRKRLLGPMMTEGSLWGRAVSCHALVCDDCGNTLAWFDDETGLPYRTARHLLHAVYSPTQSTP